MIADLAARILDVASTHDELSASCVSLFELLSEITGAFEPAADLALPSGLALAPWSAAQCVLDTNRTVAFLRGVFAAVRQVRESVGNAIEVVYAGTGPFAPLAIPLMSLPEMAGARFTLIDVHEESVAAVTRLVDHLGLHRSIRDVVCADATLYTHPDPIHVIVTETMQQALKTEPFVAIVRNLAGQLAPEGLLVPARVAVRVGDTVVFEISAEARLAKPVLVTLPPGQVALHTDIEVFDGIRLTQYESGLTTPEILWPLSSETRSATTVAFRYATGGKPGIVWSAAEESALPGEGKPLATSANSLKKDSE